MGQYASDKDVGRVEEDKEGKVPCRSQRQYTPFVPKEKLVCDVNTTYTMSIHVVIHNVTVTNPLLQKSCDNVCICIQTMEQ